MATDETDEAGVEAADSSTASPQADYLSLSDMLTVLSGRPERRILFHMHRENGPVTIERLTEQVAAKPEPLPSSRREASTQTPHDHD